VPTGDIATDDRLDREDAQGMDEHATALELLPVLLDRGGHLIHVRGDKVVGESVLQQVKPKDRYLRQETSLVRDALGEPTTSTVSEVMVTPSQHHQPASRPASQPVNQPTRTFFMATSNADILSVATKRSSLGEIR
jgi:hypothetical protein